MKAKSSSIVLFVVGAVVGIVAVFVALRPVESFFGQNCGSVFLPEFKPQYGGISKALDEAAFRLCAEDLAPFHFWTWTLLIAAASCLVGGAVLALRAAKDASSNRAESAMPAPSPTVSIATELEKLQSLHAAGALTAAEYEAAKNRVLSRES